MGKQITCKICGKETKALGTHLRYNHPEYNIKLYYDEFVKMVSEGICKLNECNNETTFIGNRYLEYCCNSHSQLDPIINEKKCKNHSKEFFEKRNENAKKTKLEKYGNENYNNSIKISNSLLNRTQEEKYEWLLKVKKTWSEKSIEEKREIRNKAKVTIIEKYGSFENYYKILNDNFFKKYGVINISQRRGQQISLSKLMASPEKKKDIKERTINSTLKTCGVKYGYNTQESINKAHKTKIKMGLIIPDDLINDFSLYKRKVAHYTSKAKRNILKTLKEDILFGLCGVMGAYQLDHMFSIKQGFLNNIPAYIIGSEINLQIISWEENDKKKDKCSIELDDLFYNYFKWSRIKMEKIK